MSPINVLWAIDHVCYDGSLHGGGRLYWNLLDHFDRDRFRIVPCLLRASQPIREVFEQSPVPVRILDKSKFDPTTLWTFLKLIAQEDIQVMHLHCYACSTFGRLASLMAGIPSIIHDYDTEVYFPYPAYLGIADRLLAPVTSGAIAASPMVKQFLIEKRKIAEPKIRTMFHAIPPEKFTPVPPARISSLRKRLGVKESDKMVGTISKLGPQRGNQDLLQAASQVLEGFPNAVFVLLYKLTRWHRLPNRKYVEVPRTDIEQEIAELKDLARELGIERQVRLIEQPENVSEWVAACDLIVAPFLSPRFSSVNLLEAMALGKPIVATDLGESGEIVKNGSNGYLVPPGDVPELAGRILQLLNSPKKLAQLSLQARASADQYSANACVETLQSWYAALAAQSR
jgi:glycosyltransferase involved in cell wall biosynthesis